MLRHMLFLVILVLLAGTIWACYHLAARSPWLVCLIVLGAILALGRPAIRISAMNRAEVLVHLGIYAACLVGFAAACVAGAAGVEFGGGISLGVVVAVVAFVIYVVVMSKLGL